MNKGKEKIFEAVGKAITSVFQEIEENDGRMNIYGNLYNIFDYSYEIDEHRINSKLEPAKTGVLHLFRANFKDFNAFPEFPNLIRLDLRECEIESFEGLRINPKVNQLNTYKCKVHSLKGLNVHQILSLLCDYEHDPNFEEFLVNLNEDERDILRDARVKLFAYPKKIVGHDIYGWFELFEKRYELITSIEGNEEFIALRKFK
jgi:hypothetical protein